MSEEKKQETVVVTKSFLAKLLGKQGSRRRRTLAAVGQDKWGITSIAIGGLTAVVSSMDAVKKSEFLRRNFWVVPLLLIIVGYLLHRKGNKNGSSLIALGVFLGVQGFQNRPKAEDKKDQATDKSAQETSGPDWTWSPYALPTAGAQWFQTPSGHHVLLPAHQAAAYSWQLPQPAPAQTADPTAVITRDIYQRRTA